MATIEKIQESIEPRARALPVKMQRRFRVTPYLFLLPAIVVLGAVVLFPIVNAFILSFYRYQLNMPALGKTFVGLDNYINTFQDKELMGSVAWTLQFTVTVVIAELVVG